MPEFPYWFPRLAVMCVVCVVVGALGDWSMHTTHWPIAIGLIVAAIFVGCVPLMQIAKKYGP